jgi:hypothetical protein
VIEKKMEKREIGRQRENKRQQGKEEKKREMERMFALDDGVTKAR